MKAELLTTLIATIGSLTGAGIGASSTLLAAKFQAGRTERANRNEKLIDSVRSTVGELLGVGMVYSTHRYDMITDIFNEVQSQRSNFKIRNEAETFVKQETDRRHRGQVSDAMLTFHSRLTYLQLLIADIDDPGLSLCDEAKKLVSLKGDELYRCRLRVVVLTHLVIGRINQNR